MRFLTTNDLEIWANTVNCKYHLPHLIRRLILATIDNSQIKNIQFSYGEDVQVGGFDGELTTQSDNMFVPLGESVWEFGTTNNKGQKANDDYEKRKQNPLGKTPSETIYININGKKYRDKSKWAEEKRSESFWKDVKYYDALDIEQWLELAPTVELWLAEKLGKPTLGIFTIEEYWKLWSENNSIRIVPEILLGRSRLTEIEKVKSFLSNDEKVIHIKSITTDESIAFPLAIFKTSEDINKSNIVVIDNRESFNRFVQSIDPLIIIAKFKIEGVDISGATQRNHKIIIPISLAQNVNSSGKIQLPIVSRDTFEEALKKMGVDYEQARILTKSSGRNISVLKRLMKFDNITMPKYLESIDINDFIPILLINRFAEDCPGDREIVEKISGKKFSEYLQFLRILGSLEDSPVYYIKGVWRLVSPTDSWLYFAKYVTQYDFESFREICLEVLSEILHKYTLPLENRGNYIQTPQNRTKYSSELREGVCESLVIISVFGEDYGINAISNISVFTEDIVQKILEKDVIIWRSLSSKLMLLAEASPSVFLNNLERIIEDGIIASFFEVEKGFMHESIDLTSLLWCLDIIAWFPEHLMRVSIILCELIKISPKDFPTQNTPVRNIKNIFRIWYPQTNTNVEDRKKILDILIRKYPKILYGILFDMIVTNQDAAFHTPRPKWRLFSELRQIEVTQSEFQYMRGFCLDSIILQSKKDIEKTILFVDLLDDIGWNEIDKVLELFKMCDNKKEDEKSRLYHKFRQFIGRHKSYPTASWSLPTETLTKIELTASKFKPKDDILRRSYLFEEHSPELINGKQGDDFREHQEKVDKMRQEFVDDIISGHGVDKIFELANQTQYPFLYGQILASSDKLNEKDRKKVYGLVESEEANMILLVTDFIRSSERLLDTQSQLNQLKTLIDSGLSKDGTYKFLNALKSNIDLWKHIEKTKEQEVEKLYWKSRQGFLYSDSKEELFFALDKLKKYKKTTTFFNTLGWGTYVHKSILTSEEVLSLLEDISLTDVEDSSNLDHSRFRSILDFLYSKDDYDVVRGAKVDMKFIFVFASGGLYAPIPKNLYRLMSQKPSEYYGILSQIYLADDDEIREIELKEIKNNPNHKYFLEAGWTILNNFNLIPSLQEDGSVNEEELGRWVDEVRKLANENHRVTIVDNCIGKLLAKYPINIKEGKGYPIEICNILERTNTDEIKQSFRVQISNNLSFTSRGAFEGGNIERNRAEFFNSLYEEIKITHPNISLIFKSLKDDYLSKAKYQDEDALLRSLE